MSSNAITITAQQRALRRKIWEKVSPKRIMESVFQKTLKKQMDLIRTKDDEIRKEAAALKQYLKSAKQALKQRKYLEFIQWVTEVDKSVAFIGAAVKDLEALRQEQVDDFYGEYNPDDPNNIVDLDKMQQNFAEPISAAQIDGLMKEAGVFDWFGSQRERAAKMLEKMYSGTLRKRHNEMTKLYGRANGIVTVVLNKLKELDKARTGRDVSKYIEVLNEIRSAHVVFNREFRAAYDANIRPIVERLSKDRATGKGPGGELAQKDTPGIDDETGKPTVPDLQSPEARETPEERQAKIDAVRQREEAQERATMPPTSSEMAPGWAPPHALMQKQLQEREVELAKLRQQYEQAGQPMPAELAAPATNLFPDVLDQMQMEQGTAVTQIPPMATAPTEIPPQMGPPPSPRLPREVGIHREEIVPEEEELMSPVTKYWDDVLSGQVAVGDVPYSRSRTQPAIEVTEKDVEEAKEKIVSEHPEAEEEAAIVVEDVKAKSTPPAKGLAQLKDIADKVKKVEPSFDDEDEEDEDDEPDERFDVAQPEGLIPQMKKIKPNKPAPKKKKTPAKAKAKPKAAPKKRGPKPPPVKTPAKRRKRKAPDAAEARANEYFLNQLKKHADSPTKMVAMLCKYSELIDDVNPQASKDLLNIAEGLLHNVK